MFKFTAQACLSQAGAAHAHAQISLRASNLVASMDPLQTGGL